MLGQEGFDLDPLICLQDVQLVGVRTVEVLAIDEVLVSVLAWEYGLVGHEEILAQIQIVLSVVHLPLVCKEKHAFAIVFERLV